MLDIQNGLDPWVMLPLTVVAILAAVETGYRVGRRQRGRPKHDDQSIRVGNAALEKLERELDVSP